MIWHAVDPDAGRLERACNQELNVSRYRALVNDTIGELDVILMTFSSLLRISQIEARNRIAGFRNIDLSAIVSRQRPRSQPGCCCSLRVHKGVFFRGVARAGEYERDGRRAHFAHW